jgi:glycosyltransferase involved in cell wall biosynthesis
MRLLFVCTDMHRGGSERQWASLIPALADRGAEVRLLCLKDEGPYFDELREMGIPAQRVAMHAALAEARGRPDAVITRAVSPQVVGQAIAWRAGAVHVYNEHTPLTADGELLPPLPRQRALVRTVAPVVDQVIAVSERQRAPLTRLGYRADRIATVPNGLFDRDVRTSAGRAQTRRSLGLAEGEFAVLCVANLRPEKGVAAFVQALARARAAGAAGLRGLVVGDGPERASLERTAAEADGVELLGSRGDVPDLLAASDAFCLLSQAEALPMSVLEAMALGLPVVAADVGGVPEAVEDGDTGLVVPPADVAAAATALAGLAADPARARAMGARGRARQRERFAGEAMVDGYLQAIEAALRR